ncbi:MAG: SDR family oxidoreductase [Rhizobiaceae bacterium]
MPRTQARNEDRTIPSALVTGGARRIGAAIVENLTANGFAVAIHCNTSRREADSLAEWLRGGGATVAVVQADLANRQETEGLIEAAGDVLGRPIQLLVNNAGLFEPDTLSDFSWDIWDRHFRVHLDAAVMLTRKFAGALPQGTEGLVVNVIDQRVWKPTPRYFSYTLSKAALWAATTTMAQALAPRIRVNAIGPGPTFKNDRQTDAQFAEVIRAIPLQRGPELSEFGATIRYLWQARSVTGQMIAIDGGQHLAWQTPDATGPGE